MSFRFNKAKTKLFKGDIDLDIDSLRILLVMTGTSVDTEKDAEFIDDFVTLDEYDGVNYARKLIANQVVTEDLANDRAYFTGDGVSWGTLGDGTTSAKGMIIFKFVTDDLDSIPIAYIDDAAIFPFQGNDQNIPIDPASAAGAEGWLDIV